MPTLIERETMRRMVDAGAQLLDVRAAEDYRAEHIQGATSQPIMELDRERAAQLDPNRPMITYCWDQQ